MAEWLKVLISALAGVVTGVTAEPVKQWVNTRFASRRAKLAIYKELGRLYFVHAVIGVSSDATFNRWALENMSTDAYDYYYETHREAIYSLTEWNELRGVYNVLKRAQQSAESEAEAKTWTEHIALDFVRRLRVGGLDETQILKYAKEYATIHAGKYMQPGCDAESLIDHETHQLKLRLANSIGP